MKQRDYKLDVVRIVACLMVILMHSPMPNMELSGIIAMGNTMITMPCIGFFFGVQVKMGVKFVVTVYDTMF